ncbi:MAG: hypothetical protein AAGB04_00145 [Pseudomonadota bacterium]
MASKNQAAPPATGENRAWHVLFEERMEREGKLQEFYDKANEISESESMIFVHAKRKAMRLFGYTDGDNERKLYRERREEEEKKAANQRQYIGASSQQRFEEGIADLPSEAADTAEFNWLRNHPALVRGANAKNKTSEVAITLADVYDSVAGKAPSRRVVYDLIHWANYPAEFRKMVITAQRKRIESKSGTVEEEDLSGGDYEDNLEEVHKVLKSLSNPGVCVGCNRPLE